MQQPNLVLNWGAIIAAMVAAFFFGFLWYTPLFGKTWGRLMGMDMENCKPDPKVLMRSLGIQVVGLFFTTYVLAHMVQVWRPSVWGVGTDAPNYMYGIYGGMFTWIGYYVPVQLGKVAWERRPWKVFLINTSHDLINLQIIAQILSNWR
jgi:hypothetical protein